MASVDWEEVPLATPVIAGWSCQLPILRTPNLSRNFSSTVARPIDAV